ncbi:MAG: TetR/AcrR family transcriptional regulator [Acidimicrobiales bacterium]|nr:TetR/AcrR family transcriptional regulator [Acidimicrobiales bacterium]
MEAAETQQDDPIRVQLLSAAARVFAAKGYSGTKINDIVKEAGLSTGAVYGRFKSKDELLREAVIAQRGSFSHMDSLKGVKVADVIRAVASLKRKNLTDAEAVRLEAFVTARREPDVASAVAEAQGEWRDAVQPLVDAAVADGTVAEGVDPEAVLYFVRTMHLGLLLQRAAGIPAPDSSNWNELITRIVASFGDGKGEQS